MGTTSIVDLILPRDSGAGSGRATPLIAYRPYALLFRWLEWMNSD